jgi:hypothetical protein
MPEEFVDRSVQYPKRFTIQADGNDGTANNPALDGEVIGLNVNPGTVNQSGTALNAEELNKRIIGDFEDKTFTQLRTLLDTLNIDKDQNANLIVKKITMLTSLNQLLINANNFSEWSPSGTAFTVEDNYIKIVGNSGNNIANYNNMKAFEANRQYTMLINVMENTLDNNFIIGGTSSDIFTLSPVYGAGEVGLKKVLNTTELDISAKTIATRLLVNNLVTTGSIKVKMAILEGDHSTISDQDAIAYIEEVDNVIARTKNPKLLTIGTNLINWKETLISDDYVKEEIIDSRNVIAVEGNGAILNKPFVTNFLPNTQYTIKCDVRRKDIGNTGGIIVIIYTDESFDLAINPSSTSWETDVFVSDIGKTIKEISWTFSVTAAISYFDRDTLQVVAGTVEPDYKPYNSNELTMWKRSMIQLN